MANNDTKKMVHEGWSVDLTSPAGGTVSGTGYIIGSLFGVAAVDSSAGDVIAFGIEGVYSLVKASGDAMTEGQIVNWDDTGKEAQNLAADRAIGYCVRAAAAADPRVYVKLTVSVAT